MMDILHYSLASGTRSLRLDFEITLVAGADILSSTGYNYFSRLQTRIFSFSLCYLTDSPVFGMVNLIMNRLLISFFLQFTLQFTIL